MSIYILSVTETKKTIHDKRVRGGANALGGD
jgi:hypothetical protein